MEKQFSFISQQPTKNNHPLDEWVIHIDGASRGNPGPASAGVFIERKNHPPIKEGIYLGEKTNNQAEYIALAYALFLVKKTLETPLEKKTIKLTFYSDSQLLVRQMVGMYKVKNESLALIKKNIDQELQSIKHTFTHVLRENNKTADALANTALDKKIKIPTDFLIFLANCGFASPR